MRSKMPFGAEPRAVTTGEEMLGPVPAVIRLAPEADAAGTARSTGFASAADGRVQGSADVDRWAGDNACEPVFAVTRSGGGIAGPLLGRPKSGRERGEPMHALDGRTQWKVARVRP